MMPEKRSASRRYPPMWLMVLVVVPYALLCSEVRRLADLQLNPLFAVCATLVLCLLLAVVGFCYTKWQHARERKAPHAPPGPQA
jgi:putative effector of murein hydrolase